MKKKLLFPLFIYFFNLSGGRGLLEKYMDCGESNVSAAEDYDYRWVGNLMQNRGPQREREREREIHTHSLHLYISISLYLFISPSLHLSISGSLTENINTVKAGQKKGQWVWSGAKEKGPP